MPEIGCLVVAFLIFILGVLGVIGGTSYIKNENIRRELEMRQQYGDEEYNVVIEKYEQPAE